MQKIIVEQPREDRFLYQLEALVSTLIKIKGQKNLIFDLAYLDWVQPLLILPLALYITDTKSDIIWPKHSDVKNYLDTIKFPYGLSAVSSLQKFKNYLPISLVRQTGDVQEKEKILYCFTDLIYKLLGKTGGIRNALTYPISELVNNIFEHSKKDYGMIFGQIYPKKKILEICIADSGRGLQASYQEELGIKYSDEEAIKECLTGHSTKKELERGYGIRTSKNLVRNGLGGEFLLISGQTAYISSKDLQKDQLFQIPNFNWQGVIISYRIPFPEQLIDIYPYLE